ncbi:MAG: cation-translocating P-type ATPase [Candidatus Heimdallarchaeaceae archaeon]
MGKKKKSIQINQEIIYGHTLTPDEVALKLGTDLKFGLKEKDIEKRQDMFGKNVIPPVKGNIWDVYLAPLFNWLINIYLIVAAILAILAIWVPGQWSQIGFWMIIILFNVAFTIFQQVRAQFKLDALHKLTAPTSVVIRDAIPDTVEAAELVPGDLIELDQGDRVPADARIIQANNCLVNESALTGESIAVEKTNNPKITLPMDTPIGQRSNMLFTGTYIESGRAVAIVTNTGIFTELGKLSKELENISTNEIPIRAKVNRLAMWLGIAVVSYLIISIIYKVLYHLKRGTLENVDIFLQDIVSSLTTSMAIMPISIPLLTTLILITGVLSMAKKRVIIRNLSAVETLGRSSILCTDKTGTITANQMTIQRIWDTSLFYGVSGTGYSNRGAIFPIGEEREVKIEEYMIPDYSRPFTKGSPLQDILIGGFLNNNAHLVVEEVFEPFHQTSWKTTGDPTDGAFLALFNKSGLREEEVKKEFGFLKEFNFDSTIKRMSKLYEIEEGYILFCKGATETVLPLCNSIGSSSSFTLLTEEKRKEIIENVNYFASQGYRVISLALRILPKGDLIHDRREEIERDLVYNGFVAMLDPPRYGVKEAVEECYNAQITPIMITGDSLLTAKAIGREVGIIREEQLAVEGNKISELSDEEFFNTRIFARVSPQHKQEIVAKYKSKNKIVSMTGDGVNDALALTNADVGICMGIAGTDVAKQASDVVIADDSFTSTVLGIREGRGLFEKIRVMIFFYITLNVAEALVYFTSSFIPGFHLLNEYQRVIIFSTAHTIPPLAFIVDSIASDIMNYPPKDNEDIFNKRYVIALASLATTLALSSGLIYILAYTGIIPVYSFNQAIPLAEDILNAAQSWEQAKARTMFVMVLVISESLVVLSLRRFNKGLLKSLKEDWKNIIMFLVLVVPIGHILTMYILPFQNFLKNAIGFNLEYLPLSIVDWLIVIPAILFPIIALEITKWLVRKKKKYF